MMAGRRDSEATRGGGMGVALMMNTDFFFLYPVLILCLSGVVPPPSTRVPPDLFQGFS